MPRIEEQYLNNVIYLYPSEDDAKKGEKTGGSGFLVFIPFDLPFNSAPIRSHVYAVTNSHVVRHGQGCGGSPVIRLTNTKGEIEILPYTTAAWHDDNIEDDLALCYIDDKIIHKLNVLMIHPDLFLTRANLIEKHIGIGTDTVTIGRFIAYETQENTPVVRFGNLAAANTVNVQHHQRTTENREFLQESWLVESHSNGGFSGSPVFACQLTPTGVEISGLLGVNWGHLPLYSRVLDVNGNEVQEKTKIATNSGMMTVIPAWKLIDFLYREDLKEERIRVEKESGLGP